MSSPGKDQSIYLVIGFGNMSNKALSRVYI